MARIIGMWGVKPVIGNDCLLSDDCVLQGEVFVGDSCEFESGVFISGVGGKIEIGKHVRIGKNVKIETMANISVQIGNHVVIEDDCTIYMSRIENNCVIKHNSVVRFLIVKESTEIEAHTEPVMGTWEGNPARMTKFESPLNSENDQAIISKIIENQKDWKKNK